MSNNPTTIQVRLADAPTDVLVELVDHGPQRPGQLAARFSASIPSRPGLTDLTFTDARIQVRRALALLEGLGYAEPRDPDLAWPSWRATTAGTNAVNEARKARTLAAGDVSGGAR